MSSRIKRERRKPRGSSYHTVLTWNQIFPYFEMLLTSEPGRSNIICIQKPRQSGCSNFLDDVIDQQTTELVPKCGSIGNYLKSHKSARWRVTAASRRVSSRQEISKNPKQTKQGKQKRKKKKENKEQKPTKNKFQPVGETSTVR